MCDPPDGPAGVRRDQTRANEHDNTQGVDRGYCKAQRLEQTRSRAYKKNDQALVEQKNGAIVRRLVGYGRLSGAKATKLLAQSSATLRDRHASVEALVRGAMGNENGRLKILSSEPH